MSSAIREAFAGGIVLLLAAGLPVRAACTDSDGDGYYAESGCGTAVDCNDRAPGVHPGAVELCNGFDDNCDGSVDEGCATSCGNPSQIGATVTVDVPPSSDENPVMAWTGSQYGVAWVQYTSGDPSYLRNVRLARLDANGSVLGQTQVSEAGLTENPQIVWTGSEYGIVWQASSEIFFQRIGSDGVAMGTNTQVSDADSSSSTEPGLAWTGHEFGVVWIDTRSGAAQVYFTRLDADGNKIGGDLMVSDAGAAPFLYSPPGIAWNGTNYGIVWQDGRAGNDEIYFARLDATGAKIGSDVRVTNDAGASTIPSIGWNGTAFGIAWFDDRDGAMAAYFTLLDPTGSKLTGDVRVQNPGTPYALSATAAPLVWTGSEWELAWTDARTWLWQVYLGRLDANGNKIGNDIELTGDTGGKYWPALVRNGSGFAIAWSDESIRPSRIEFARFGCCDPSIDADGDGANQCVDCDDTNPLVHPGAAEVCDFVDNDCNGLVDEGFDQDGDGVTTCGGDCDDTNPMINGRGEIPCDGIDEGCDGPGNEAPDADGDGWDVCGPSDPINPDGLPADPNDNDPNVHPGATEICFNGIDDNGDGQIDEGCTTTCTLPQRVGAEEQLTQGPGDNRFSSVVWTGSSWGVGFLGPTPILHSGFLQRIDRTGTTLGAPKQLTEAAPWAAQTFALAWTGRDYGACWQDRRENELGDIYAQTFDSAGDPRAGIERESQLYLYKGLPSIVWNGHGYALAWEDARSGTPTVYLALTDADGVKIGNDIAVGNAVGADPGGDLAPALLWTGTNYAVAWRDASSGNGEIYFARVDANGAPIGMPVRVTDDTADSYSPSLAWTGTEYGLAWTDGRSGQTSNIYFTRLDSGGTKIGTDIPLTAVVNPRYGRNPSLTWTGSEFGVVWQDLRILPLTYAVDFARLDSTGAKIGTDVTVTTNTNGDSWLLDLVWNGSEYGLGWYDARTGDNEIYFARIGCCGEDRDGDGSMACNDCNDTDPSVHPGAPEICNGIDDNCDGTIDEGFPVPGGVAGLTFDADKSTLRWNSALSADRYDVTKGDLVTLRASLGNFTAAVSECLSNDSTTLSAADASAPAAGGGFFYLVRAQAACKSGSYDSGAASQVQSRDASIEASGSSCP